MNSNEHDDFTGFLSRALDPGEIELGPGRRAELLAAMGALTLPSDDEAQAFSDFLSQRLDPGEIELDPAARQRITGTSETLRAGDLIAWALGELPLSRRETVEEILSVRPDLCDEAQSLRQFCLRLRERLPALPRPGPVRRMQLRRLYREGAQRRTWPALTGVAALVALLLAPAAFDHGPGAVNQEAHLSPAVEVRQANGRTMESAPVEASPSFRHSSEDIGESSAQVAMKPFENDESSAEGDGPVEIAESIAPAREPGDAIPVAVFVAKKMETWRSQPVQLAEPVTEKRVPIQRLLAGSGVQPQSQSLLTHPSATPSVALVKNLGFETGGTALQLNAGEPGPPTDDGVAEAFARRKSLVAAFANGTSVLANLQPYLLTALAGSTSPQREVIAPEAGFVWNANADYRTLDFDSFASAAGMKVDTWTGTVSAAKAVTDSLTLGANLSSLDSRGHIDRYGKIDVTGGVAGWSLDWKEGPWELGVSHSIALLNQDLIRTSGGARTASQDATLQQIELRAAWKKDLGPFRLGPVANLQSTWGHLDPYQEPGADGVAMAGRDFDSTVALAGWEIDGSFDTAMGAWNPHLLAGWRHRLGVSDSVVKQESYGAIALFQPDVPDRNSLLVEAGMQWEQKGGPFYAEAAAGIECRGGDTDRSLLLRIGAKF
jgi:uncharacterized protein YhjY with autotransporter beta-barrel domain